MDLRKIAVKFFLERPCAELREKAVSVFHRWIQESALPGLLVDVADYGHLPKSPGTVLVSHEAIWSVDETEGGPGLLYTRRQPIDGAPAERFRAAFRDALRACVLLEKAPEFSAPPVFRADEAWVIANDRLAAPNDEAGFRSIQPALAEAAATLWGGSASLSRDGRDPRTRLTALLKGKGAGGVAALLERLK
jgi:hypothetical protein